MSELFPCSRSIRPSSLPLVMLCIAVSLLVACPSSEAQAGESIVVGGTGCAAGGIKLVAGAYRKHHPDVEFRFLPSLGSSGGIKALLAGSLDIALSARPLKDEERANGADAFAYARTPFVFAVSRGQTQSAFTLDQVVAIYAGEMRQWPDGRQLRLVLRPESDTDTAILRSMSPSMEKAVNAAHKREGMLIAITDQENADLLINVKGSFGAMALSQILSEHLSLKAITLDGVAPSVKTVVDGTYPHAKTLYVVTRRADAKTRGFLRFLASPEARAILTRNGHVVRSQP